MLSDLNDQLMTVVVDLDGIKQIGQVVGVELDIKNRTDDCHDRAYVLICHTVIFPFHLMWLEITRRTMHFVHCTPGFSAAHEFPASPEIRTIAETDAFFPPAEPEQKMI